MPGLSAFGETQVLSPLTTSVFVSLHTSDPVPTPGSSEVTGGGYARVSVATSGGFTNTGSNPTLAANTGIVTFNTATAGWGTVTHFAIWTALTAGNILGSGTLTPAKTINVNDVARFSAGALTIQAD